MARKTKADLEEMARELAEDNERLAILLDQSRNRIADLESTIDVQRSLSLNPLDRQMVGTLIQEIRTLRADLVNQGHMDVVLGINDKLTTYIRDALRKFAQSQARQGRTLYEEPEVDPDD